MFALLLLTACIPRPAPWHVVVEMEADSIPGFCERLGAGKDKDACALPGQIVMPRGWRDSASLVQLYGHEIEHLRKGRWHE